jgi:hypothetical protein
MKHAIPSRPLLALSIACLFSMPAAHAADTPERAPTAAVAQQMVDKLVGQHPELLDVIFHVTPPGSVDNFAIASYTKTERGLKSGEDDLGVMTNGKPLVEVQKDGVRIGVLVPLKDMNKRTIGTLGLMYAYRAGQNEHEFLNRSEKIRDQLAKAIPSREALF